MTRLARRVVNPADLLNLSDIARGIGQLGVPATLLAYGVGTLGNWMRKRPPINAVDRGYSTANTAAANDAILQALINEVNAAGGGAVFIGAGVFPFYSITMASNVTLIGVRGATWLQQLQPATNVQTGFLKPAGGGSLSNWHIVDIGFDGQRLQNPANVSNHVFLFDAGAGETVSDISFHRCDFKNAQEDCIRFQASAITGTMQRLRVIECSGITEDAFLWESTNKPATDLVRIEQTYDYATSGNGYGNVQFTHVTIANCYARHIRTLADIKRGVKGFTVAGNTTEDMYDCHHSVDGSFDGVLVGNVGTVNSGATIAGTWTNFIEVQGEHVLIEGNSCDGGGKLISGIMVTAYGRTQEGGKGHRSVKVIVRGNTIKSNTTNAYRILDGYGCAIVDNDAESCGVHTASIECGTYKDADGVTNLWAIGCEISGVRSKGAGAGVFIASAAVGCIYGPCFDENGQDFYDLGTDPQAAGVLRPLLTWAPFRNKAGTVNANPDPWLDFAGFATGSKWWTAALAIAAAATKPSGAPQAVVLQDPNSGSIQTVDSNTQYPCKQKERWYFRCEALYNTSAHLGVRVREFDSSGTQLGEYWYGVSGFNASGASWAPWGFRHTGVNATCDHLQVSIAPAASYGTDAATTGNTNIANVRISRLALGAV